MACWVGRSTSGAFTVRSDGTTITHTVRWLLAKEYFAYHEHCLITILSKKKSYHSFYPLFGRVSKICKFGRSFKTSLHQSKPANDHFSAFFTFFKAMSQMTRCFQPSLKKTRPTFLRYSEVKSRFAYTYTSLVRVWLAIMYVVVVDERDWYD